MGEPTDINEQKPIAQALRESEERLRKVVENAPVVLWALDCNGVFTLSEGKGLQAMGLRPGEVVGQSAFEIYGNEPQITELLNRALSGEDVSLIVDLAELSFDCHVSPIVGADGKIAGMIGVGCDITERRQAELQSRLLLDELAQVGRISTMGEMASGLAHELNQPLAAIVAYVDACQELVESGKMDNRQLAEVLQSVSGQAERAGQIIHRLRRMIKRNDPIRSSMSLNDAVREVAVLFEAEARQAGIMVELDLEEDLLEAAADFLQIQQVVLHLMRNGLEAMMENSRDDRKIKVATRQTPECELEIAVSDLGNGLPRESSGRMFEPFFSTKPNGLGLGLSISRTIVEAHGGRIWMTPNSTRGVTARFTLPTSGGKVSHVPETNRIYR